MQFAYIPLQGYRSFKVHTIFRDIVTQYISIITRIYYKLASVQVAVVVIQLFYFETLQHD